MFGEQAFRSWPFVLSGALVFAGLFGVAMWMGGLLVEEQADAVPQALGLAAAAFVGYVGVALLLRRDDASG